MQQKTKVNEARTVELVALLPETKAGTAVAPQSWLGRLLSRLRHNKPFVVFVVVPTFFAALYYVVLAADRFEAESRFVVRSPGATATSQIASLVQGSSIVRSADDAHIVQAYIGSRDAVRKLVADINLLDMLNRPQFDVLWRYPGFLFAHNEERLWKHVQSLVSADYDQTTGISTLRVQAFWPGDAKRISDALLGESEVLINRLSERAQADAIRTAREEVETSRKRVLEAQERLTAFRNRESIVDPTRVSTSALETISRLALETAQTNAQLAELQQASPQSPQSNTLKLRIAALEEQIVKERRLLAGSDNSLALLLAEYERLVLEREFGERTFASALSALEVARVDAQRQRLFLEKISNPIAPDYAKYPYRLLGMLMVFAVAFMLYGIGRRFVADMRSHATR